jgi:hypothetical protein
MEMIIFIRGTAFGSEREKKMFLALFAEILTGIYQATRGGLKQKSHLKLY